MNAANHGYHCFTSLCSHPVLPNRRQSVGMLQHILEKATNTVPPSGQPLWHLADDLLGVVTWWAINHVGVDSIQ